MINIIYIRLFNLNIAHNYYENGIVKGLSIVPTIETSKLLMNGKMLFKTIPKGGGFVVLYKAQTDEVTPLIDLGKDLKFTFIIKSDVNSEFFNITDLDESVSKVHSSANIIYFRNDPATASDDPSSPELINHSIIDKVRTSLFTYQFELNSNPAQVLFRVTDESGSPISVGKEEDGTPYNTTLTLFISDSNSFQQQIDLRNKSKGKYTITIRDTGDTTTLKEEVIYVDDLLVPQKMVGVIDLVYDTANNEIYGNTEQYQLVFERKNSIWKYLVVNKNNKVDLTAKDLSIVDEGSATGPYVVNTFAREGTEPHGSIRINDLDTVIFKSNIPIPFYEQPKINLELRTNPGNDKLVTHLPNPAHSGVIKKESGDQLSEIYVFI